MVASATVFLSLPQHLEVLTAQTARATPRPAAAEGACTAREISRNPLMPDDSHLLYVEPVVLNASNDGSVLLAGTHNHLFRNTPGLGWRMVVQDSVFGAVLSTSGRVRTVRSPVSVRRVTGIRAVAREGGGWSVVFAELRPSTGEVENDTVARLWYGVIEGGRLSALEAIPLPDSGRVQPFTASSLIRSRDGLAWAMPYSGDMITPGLIVYERRNGRWSYERIPMGYARGDLAYSDSSGLVLATQQADFRLMKDGNSLLLWTRDPTWRMNRSVVAGSRERAHAPAITLSPAGSALTWSAAVPGARERLEAHAISTGRMDSTAHVMVLDSSIMPMYPISFVPLPQGPKLWVTDHLFPDGTREIRFVRDSAGTPATAARLPNPYFSPLRAVGIGSADVLVSGGVLRPDTTAGYSLLVRMRLECTPGQRERS